MCGIYLKVIQRPYDVLQPWSSSDNQSSPPPTWLLRRGPDHCSSREFVIKQPPPPGAEPTVTHVHLHASVLRMRQELVPQPVTFHSSSNSSNESEEDSMCLAWNGEIYQMVGKTNPSDNQALLEDVWQYAQSDTRRVVEVLQNALQEGLSRTKSSESASSSSSRLGPVVQAMSTLVNAEFAFCLVTSTGAYYGRDALGRRSLLVRHNGKGGTTTITPSAPSSTGPASSLLLSDWETFELASVGTPSTTASKDDQTMHGSADVWVEVQPGAVFYYSWETNTIQSMSFTELLLPPPPSPNLMLMTMMEASQELEELLLRAVERRLTIMISQSPPTALSSTITKSSLSPPPPPRGVAILFSGGLDSVVLAALALKAIPADQHHALTLVNVSFVDQRVEDNVTTIDANTTTTTTIATTAADTVAAVASYHELQSLYPHHTIRFLHQQTDWETIRANEAHIRSLVYPKCTTMDVNIGTALWFAASAAATDNDNNNHEEPAPRVLLSGLGADELMGGYNRHRLAWVRGGAAAASKDSALRRELDRDMARLWERNLGRDDRVLSDTGTEVRFPYLDLHVVQYLRNLPAHCICNYELPSGQGDKQILRLLAARLGLLSASRAVKRAIQFGSRIAHVSDKRRFGSRRKANGDATIVVKGTPSEQTSS